MVMVELARFRPDPSSFPFDDCISALSGKEAILLLEDVSSNDDKLFGLLGEEAILLEDVSSPDDELFGYGESGSEFNF